MAFIVGFLPWYAELLLVLVLAVVAFVKVATPVSRKELPEEGFSLRANPKGEPTKHKLPTLEDKGTLDLSLVVPAYNETKRLPPMLDEAFAYLTSRTQKDPSFTYEILIVDDGSKDGTAQFALEYAKKHNNAHVHVVTLTLNRGKGGAVKHGMVHAAGKLILFLDADGASKMSEVEQLEAAVKKLSGDSKVSEVAAVAIGSRASLVPDTLVRRSFLRNTLMFCFHLIVHMIGVQGIADTQCGFKLFTRQAAREIFPNMHVEGWIFDIEILMLAQFFKIPIKECAIVWEEIDGSKVNIIVDSLRMLKDLVIIRLNYMLGSWQAESWSSKAKKRS